MKDISIIIPVRDRCEILVETLYKLNEQENLNELDWEVIIVDNASTEDVVKTVSECNLAYSYKLVKASKYINNRSYVRNVGVREASGKILVFIDSDIILMPQSIRAHYDRVIHQPDQISIGYTFQADYELKEWPSTLETAEQTKGVLHDRRQKWFDNQRYKENWEYGWLFCYSGNISMNAEWIKKTNGFDEEFAEWGCEDTEFAFRLKKCGASFYFNKEAAGYHYPHIWHPANRGSYHRTRDFFYQKSPCFELELLATGRTWRLLEMLEHVDSIKSNVPDWIDNLKFKVDIAVGDEREMQTDYKVLASVYTLADYCLFGFKLPYAEHEVNTLLLLPSWRHYNRGDFAEILIESKRVARKVYIVCLKNEDLEAKWDGTINALRKMLVEHYSLKHVEDGRLWELWEVESR